MSRFTITLLLIFLLISCGSKTARTDSTNSGEFKLEMKDSLSSDSIRTMKMQTTGMEGTIKKGDIVKVQGVGEIKRNQIVTFKHYDERFGDVEWCFRVIGIPGDVIELKKGEVFLNGQLLENPTQTKFSYNVETISNPNEDTFKEYDYIPLDKNKYIFYLSSNEYNNLNSNSNVKKIVSNIEKTKSFDSTLYQSSKTNKWNVDNYGPISIPSKTDKGYVEDSYFLLGDSRHASKDSRYIGLIPKSKIVGLVLIPEN